MQHDEQSQEWEHVKSPSPQEMEKMVEVIYTLLPKQFSKAHLESQYSFLNQASNSPLLETEIDIEHNEDGNNVDSHIAEKLKPSMKGKMHHEKEHNETD